MNITTEIYEYKDENGVVHDSGYLIFVNNACLIDRLIAKELNMTNEKYQKILMDCGAVPAITDTDNYIFHNKENAEATIVALKLITQGS